MGKKCNKCNSIKSEDQYYSYIKNTCIECHRLKQKIYHQNNKEKRNADGLMKKMKKRYGITPNIKSQMLIEQSNKCAICNNEMKKACVDHNHKTGQIRKLLCFHCNVMIGHAKESIEILTNAIDYLTKEKGR